MKKLSLFCGVLMFGLISNLNSNLVFAGELVVTAGNYNQSVRQESKFYGVIEKMPPNMVGKWTISGREITVTPYTKIKEKRGTMRVGAQVEVEGYNDIKSFTAKEIEVDGNKHYGTVGKMPTNMIGTWIVSGREITVTNHTIIKSKGRRVDVGATVEVEGQNEGKAFIAYKIKVKR